MTHNPFSGPSERVLGAWGALGYICLKCGKKCPPYGPGPSKALVHEQNSPVNSQKSLFVRVLTIVWAHYHTAVTYRPPTWFQHVKLHVKMLICLTCWRHVPHVGRRRRDLKPTLQHDRQLTLFPFLCGFGEYCVLDGVGGLMDVGSTDHRDGPGMLFAMFGM